VSPFCDPHPRTPRRESPPSARLSEAEINLQDAREDIKSKELFLDSCITAYLNSTRRRHAQELEELLLLWRSDSVRRRYFRPSRQAAELRGHEQMLLQGGRVAEAEVAARAAAARERQDEEAANRAMLRDCREARRRLQVKQKKEIAIARDRVTRKKDEFEYFANKSVCPLSARLKALGGDDERGRTPRGGRAIAVARVPPTSGDGLAIDLREPEARQTCATAPADRLLGQCNFGYM
jgi:hypothetical protein